LPRRSGGYPPTAPAATAPRAPVPSHRRECKSAPQAVGSPTCGTLSCALPSGYLLSRGNIPVGCLAMLFYRTTS
jgi:hypothetical protein